MSIGRLKFDTTDANTIADSHTIGAYTLSSDGSLVTSGDGNSDDIANTFEGLDTRSFGFIYDSVGDNWDRLQGVNGAVKVFIDDGDFEVDVVINAEKAEDSAHVSGDIGNYVLGVRIDDLSVDNSALLAGTNGDYQGFFTNAKGEMYVKDSDVLAELQGGIDVSISNDTNYGVVGANTLRTAAQIGNATGAADFGAGNATAQTLRVTLADDDEIDVNDAALANTAIQHAQQAATAADTAESTVDSILADRKYLFLANEGNRKISIGGAGVTDADGFPIYPNMYLMLRAGAAVDVQWAAPATANSDLRTLELS